MQTYSSTCKVNSPNVVYSKDCITSKYTYNTEVVTKNENGEFIITPKSEQYQFKTETTLPKLGMLIVGWGGNNGSTITGAIEANKRKIKWNTKDGEKEPNYFGSITQSSTVSIGVDDKGNDVYVPLNNLLPMVHPNDIVISGWDINNLNIAEAMKRACVFDYDLQRQLYEHLEHLKPMPSIYYPDFIAANQSDRANNLIEGKDKQQHLEKLRADIRNFKENNKLDKVVVIWSANTERFAEIIEGVNDTADNLLNSIKNSHEEVSPSTIFAVASIIEGVPFINGSPQNTFVPGCIELAERHKTFIGGDDFKSGQTKMKSVLVDFLVSAGIKPTSITSYNHLGNNDGKNLSAPSQFRSKEISKSNVVDDMVASNNILYKEGEHPDHIVVIKYVPYVKDSKRALDEYISEIFMNGTNTISMHNTCEDSLLASPLILDLVIIAELFTRIQYKTEQMRNFSPFHSVLSILSYLLKAPLVQKNTPVVNSLFKQRCCIINIFRACIGLPPVHEMQLENRTWKTTGGSVLSPN